jgi:hypothetical protein
LLKQKKIRTNKVNGKSYIGSSVDLGRFTEYFSSKYLQGVLDRNESLIPRAWRLFHKKKVISIFLLYKKMGHVVIPTLSWKSNFLKK